MNKFGKTESSPRLDAKKLIANHTFHPVLEGNEYTLLETGRDYYKIKCKGAAYYSAKWPFDLPPKRVPKWVQEEEYDEEW